MRLALVIPLVAAILAATLRQVAAARLTGTATNAWDGPILASCKGFSQRLDVNKAKLFKKLDGAKESSQSLAQAAVDICRKDIVFRAWERDLATFTEKNVGRERSLDDRLTLLGTQLTSLLRCASPSRPPTSPPHMTQLITAQGKHVSGGPVATCFAKLHTTRALYYKSLADKVAGVTKDVLESVKTDVLSAAAVVKVKHRSASDKVAELWKALDALTKKVRLVGGEERSGRRSVSFAWWLERASRLTRPFLSLLSSPLLSFPLSLPLPLLFSPFFSGLVAIHRRARPCRVLRKPRSKRARRIFEDDLGRPAGPQSRSEEIVRRV